MPLLNLTKENFLDEAIRSKGRILMNFWAPWCAPCRAFAPVIDSIAKDDYEDLKVCNVNVEEEPEIASVFNVMRVPTLVVMEGGLTLATSVGFRPRHEVVEFINGL
ncbi:MAG: thioredoxin family protein [Christensenellales bacterium]|jgi:thioredoxin 1